MSRNARRVSYSRHCVALAAITHLDQLVRRRDVLWIEFQFRLGRNPALSPIQQRSHQHRRRVFPRQRATHQCVDWQPYISEGKRTLHGAGINERVVTKPRRIRNDVVIQNGGRCDLRRRIHRIDIVHCQYNSYIAGDGTAPPRRSGRVQRRMKHLLHSVRFCRIQPRREYVMVPRRCGKRRPRDGASNQRLYVAVAARRRYAKTRQTARNRNGPSIESADHSIRCRIEDNVSVLQHRGAA